VKDKSLKHFVAIRVIRKVSLTDKFFSDVFKRFCQ